MHADFFGQMLFLTPVIRYDDNIRMLLKERVCVDRNNLIVK